MAGYGKPNLEPGFVPQGRNQMRKHPFPDHRLGGAPGIAARPGAPKGFADIAPPVGKRLHAATGPAVNQAGKRMRAGRSKLHDRLFRLSGAARLHGVAPTIGMDLHPQFVIHDAQFRNGRADPFGFRIQGVTAAACVRVHYLAGAVIDQ